VWAATGGSISSTGLYTPGPVGTFTVYANDSGISGSAKVTVTVGALASIDVTPKNPTITVEQTQQFNAMGKDSKGNNIPLAVNWSTNAGNITAGGLYTPPTKPGTYRVWANASGKSGSTDVIVTAGSPVSITVSPKQANITTDDTQQFNATILDKYGNPVNVNPTWSATGGSISTTGLYTPGPVGVFTVTAAIGSLSDSAVINVTLGGLATIELTPKNPTISVEQTQQFIAEGKDSKGNKYPITAFNWSTDSGNITTSGLYTPPTKPGLYTVWANASGKSGHTGVNVTPGAPVSVTVSPKSATITADQTQQFTASVVDRYGNPVPVTVSWSTTGGSISASGLYTPGKTGNYTVTATAGSLSDTARITVLPGSLSQIIIDPPSKTITMIETVQFTARGMDAKGNDIPITPSWSASGGSITQTGLYTPTKTGTYTIYAVQSGITGTATVIVKVGPLSTITIDPGNPTITIEQTQQFTARGFDAKGNEVNIRPVWTIEEGSMSIDGVYTPTKVGKWKITVSDGGISNSTYITVLPGRLKSASIDPPNATLKVGQTVSFTIRGFDSKGNELENLSISWSISPDIGSISQDGVFTAHRAGKGKVIAQASKDYETVTVQASIVVKEESAGDALIKIFGNEMNLYLFIILLIALVSVIAVAAVLYRRKKRWQEDYERAMLQAMPPPEAPQHTEPPSPPQGKGPMKPPID